MSSFNKKNGDDTLNGVDLYALRKNRDLLL